MQNLRGTRDRFNALTRDSFALRSSKLNRQSVREYYHGLGIHKGRSLDRSRGTLRSVTVSHQRSTGAPYPRESLKKMSATNGSSTRDIPTTSCFLASTQGYAIGGDAGKANVVESLRDGEP